MQQRGTDGLERRRRLALLMFAVVAAALVASSQALHQRIVDGIALAEPVIAAHPRLGAVVFTALSALGAILIFVSSWLLVPIGVQAWGPWGCFVLLLTGWFIGGAVTYSIGRFLGRPVVRVLLPDALVARYEGRIPTEGRFLPALLVTVSVPSDIGGYFFGLVRYPARVYFAALLLGEVPYGLGAVLLSDAFLQRRLALMLFVAGVTGLVLVWAWRRRRGPPAPSKAPATISD
jgi:uncharacterized membrane protein YdjX (TVP38/TMEM64 family)